MKLPAKLTAIILLVISTTVCSYSAFAQSGAYRFGVFPYLSPSRMDDIYSPVSREFSQALQRKVKFRTSTTLPKFRENLVSGSYDLVLIQPMLYPLAVDKLGYVPLVRMQEPVFSSMIVREDSPVLSIRDLVGKTIATPPANGPVVVLAKRHLIKHGISPQTDIRFQANKTVGACLRQVLVGQADACIAPNFAVAPFEKSAGTKMRRLFRTEGVPNRALVAHPGVSKRDRDRIRDEILSWPQSEIGRGLLKSINTQGFVEVDDADYAIVREIARDAQN